MVNKELEKLRKEIAEERRKVAAQKEFRKLKIELKELKTPKRTALLKKIKAGFTGSGKIAGQAIIKQAKLIRQEQERERARVLKKAKKKLQPLGKKVITKGAGTILLQEVNGFNGSRRVRVVRRRPKARRKKVRRGKRARTSSRRIGRARETNGGEGFFGGLPGLEI